MMSKNQYDLVSEDGCDVRIPLHNDEAFKHGIHFQTKYIGTMDVPRPSSRVEIVAAMRKIRYDFKLKGVKKRKVCLSVSVDGVKITQSRKHRRSVSSASSEENRELIAQHPIFRIFYVSHDSQDLKIWSYIVRDGPSNCFKCSVFKAFKKNQATRIVRTIGQAFEVCHKLDAQTHLPMKTNEDPFGKSKEKLNVSTESPPPYRLASPTKNTNSGRPSPIPSPEVSKVSNPDPAPISTHQHVMLLRQQIEQQQHQTQIAIGQVQLLKDQLTSETAARIEAQARSHQLLMHNRDMLDQMAQLVARLQELELKVTGAVRTADVESLLPPPPALRMPVLPDPTTPQAGPVYTPEYFKGNAFEKPFVTDFDTDSPDSGHKEMSTESLAVQYQNSNTSYWQNVLNGELISLSSPSSFAPGTICHVVEDIAAVTGNPFASGFTETFEDQEFLKDNEHIITPCPPQDACGNRLELKLTRTPRIAPPPEFRNSKSYRDSQYSVQSTESASSQDTTLYIRTPESDYFSSNMSGSMISQNSTSGNVLNLPSASSQCDMDSKKDSDVSPSNSLGSSSHSSSSTRSELSQIQRQTKASDRPRAWPSPRSPQKQEPEGVPFSDFKTIEQREVSISPNNNKPGPKKSPISENQSVKKLEELPRKRQLQGYRDLVIKPAPPPPPPRTVDRL
ncbi:carboxyl-terminal PDZ ligand of neuronal nitric oxide synthase protein-like [Crassostrea angulata]|uniref:carboxyl-terminal PDZ ligand of neuronal nitric oxide synthase protein-like n=1 Tax=Magallana angulata TaxID=2784310 RepID=UPI0022B1245F|nr:carboxyl-terminal PDZ ligand of neuronal nitric oxide synthase protein-like [Crassostrea angulata]XP_052719730.1 carboxyl-terminal PDZ ligand of neuronal nitric oxide synthase protein-like [Crassostrea angulata]XP_052719731.1 carboxyl-terminal PDZ ligand of neuronal nitric oxide synthase protein-like [Crassostrea angulata]XP_052719732.1 carboxyl-terminal PDZ ligand of neuronal nitric oxide synthase protein-like [Crassostrea angulata]XP_052719733.1 carboxyl-terminal PDZ ligand of neuronal nit